MRANYVDATSSQAGPAINAAAAADLARHGRMVVSPPELGTAVLLIQTRHGVFAVENRCGHLDRPLTDATVKSGAIVCPAHRRRFDLRTGECRGSASMTEPIRVWPARVAGGRVWLGQAAAPPPGDDRGRPSR